MVMLTDAHHNMFDEMRFMLLSKQSYHKTKRDVYKGNLEAESLNIALPKKFDQKLHTKLDWGGIGVNTHLNDVTFDGFANDTIGFTKLLYLYGGYKSIKAAQRNSRIGACSFISVLPRSNGDPVFTTYSGSEATAIFNSKDGFIAGLAVNNRTNNALLNNVEDNIFMGIKDYLFFLPGYVARVTPEFQVIEEVNLNIDRLLLIPFVNQQDVAVSPFGSSLLNQAFIYNLEGALRTQKLIEIGHDVAIAFRNLLLADGSPSDLAKAESTVDITKILAIFNQSGGKMQLEQLTPPSTTELQQMLAIYAANAASSISLTSDYFGFQPSNGAFSAETLSKMSKPYDNVIREAKESDGESIKELAITAMAISTGQYFNEWQNIQPRFLNNISVDRFGAVADGIGKLQTVAPNIDFSQFIQDNIISKSVRDDALQVSLPDFTAARNAAVNFKISDPLADYEVM